MSEQGITQEDCEWINQRLDGGGSCFQDMEAAPARGYERGKAEGAADRDRLAKRLESADAMIEMYRAKCEVFRERLHAAQPEPSDRLAALEQRVGGIVETLWAEPDTETAEYRRRLAALRSPAPEVDGLRAQVAAAERSEDRLTREVLTARRERDEARASMKHEAAIAIRIMQERDAAMEALHGTRARALVAGQPPPAQRGAEIETLRAKLAEAERCAQESADIMRRARDRAESYCLRLGEAESQRDALRQHALKLDGLCERAADVALRVVAVGKPTPSLVLDLGGLENAIRARGEVPR